MELWRSTEGTDVTAFKHDVMLNSLLLADLVLAFNKGAARDAAVTRKWLEATAPWVEKPLDENSAFADTLAALRKSQA